MPGLALASCIVLDSRVASAALQRLFSCRCSVRAGHSSHATLPAQPQIRILVPPSSRPRQQGTCNSSETSVPSVFRHASSCFVTASAGSDRCHVLNRVDTCPRFSPSAPCFCSRQTRTEFGPRGGGGALRDMPHVPGLQTSISTYTKLHRVLKTGRRLKKKASERVEPSIRMPPRHRKRN